jgi:hypothetical protein
MSDALIVAALSAVAVIAATLSFVAWYLLRRRLPLPDEPRQPQLDSDDPDV